MNRFSLPLIARISPYLLLFAVQQVGQHMRIGHAGCRRDHRMHDDLLAIHADMRLGSEIPLLSLPGLMHRRIALAGGVLRRTGSVDQRCIHDGSSADPDPLAIQIEIHRIQHLAA